MANNQLFSRGRVLIAGLAAGALLAAPTTATAVPMDPEPAPASAPVASATTRAAAEVQPATVELPAPSGRLKVGTTELHLVDPKRDDPRAPGGKRELMVSLWYPAARFIGDSKLARYMPAKTAAFVDAPWSNAIQSPPGTFDFAESKTHALVGVPVKQGKHPVVLFSPGLGFSRFLNTALLEDLASQGYLVVAMDHTHESPVEFPGGRFVPGVESNPDADAYREAIATRTADARFVLDQVSELAGGGNPDAERRKLPVGLHTAIDHRKVGMLGFSAGGFTTAMTMREDRRIAAGIDLDGTLQYNFEQGPLSEVAEKGLDRPFLLFGSNETQRRDPAGAYFDKSWASFWQAQSGWKLNLQLPGALHKGLSDYQFVIPQVLTKVFGDEAWVPTGVKAVVGTVEPDRSVQTQRAYVTAFFDQFLQRKPQRLLREESPDFPEVSFVR